MPTINFNLRSKKSEKPTPINMVVWVDGARLVYPTLEKIEPKYWSTEAQRAKKSYKDSSRLNGRLQTLYKGVEECYKQFLDDNGFEPLTEELKEQLDFHFKRARKDKEASLFDFIEKFIGNAHRHTYRGKKITPKTIQKYKTALSHLQEFDKQYKRKVNFKTIDYDFYQDYIDFLTIDKEMATNTVGKYIQTLKTFLNEASKKFPIPQTHRESWFIAPSEEADNIYLNFADLYEIQMLDLSHSPRLDNARDLFLVGCFTGLRYGDFSTIKPHEVKEDSILKRTQKTGAEVRIMLVDELKAILSKYNGKTKNSLPRKISTQKLNDYAKEWGAMLPSLQEIVTKTRTKAGITETIEHRKFELISSHTARRTFATNSYLSKVAVVSIMQITGHKSMSAFLKYIKADSLEHATLVKEAWESNSLFTKSLQA